MASITYDSFKTDILKSNIDLSGATIKAMLVTSSYTALASHSFRSSVTNEVTGTGYTTGGVTLANKVVNIASNIAKWDADDPSWATSTITARALVLYKSTGSAATDNLIAYIDFGQDYTSAVGTFSVVFNASGILTIT